MLCWAQGYFFSRFYQLSLIRNYCIPWLSILMLQWRERLVKLTIYFMIASIQVMYKLQMHIKFFSTDYKDSKIEVR